LARRIDLESAFLDALRTTRKIARGPKPVRALREVGLDADIPADEPTPTALSQQCVGMTSAGAPLASSSILAIRIGG
ncbi:MAG: hypothetical protein WA863_02775, partial [Methyloceanibacter sp.]